MILENSAQEVLKLGFLLTVSLLGKDEGLKVFLFGQGCLAERGIGLGLARFQRQTDYVLYLQVYRVGLFGGGLSSSSDTFKFSN